VKRNSDRFPDDFMFQLDSEEFENWISQIVISGQHRRVQTGIGGLIRFGAPLAESICVSTWSPTLPTGHAGAAAMAALATRIDDRCSAVPDDAQISAVVIGHYFTLRSKTCFILLMR
jgi:hypothetical protein